MAKGGEVTTGESKVEGSAAPEKTVTDANETMEEVNGADNKTTM